MIYSVYKATASTCLIGFTLLNGTCNCDPILQNTLTSVILLIFLTRNPPIMHTLF